MNQKTNVQTDNATTANNDTLFKEPFTESNQPTLSQNNAASSSHDAALPLFSPQASNSSTTVNFPPNHAPNVPNVHNIAPGTLRAGALGAEIKTTQTNPTQNANSFNEIPVTQDFQKLALAITSNPQLRQNFLTLLSNQNFGHSNLMRQQFAQMPMMRQADYLQHQNPNLQPENTYPQGYTNSTATNSQALGINEFCAQNNDFFNASEARLRLKDYLARFCGHLTQDELIPILNLASELENSAVSKFQAQNNYSGALKDSNSKTLQKLQTQASNPKPPSAAGTKNYSRADIATMTHDEFSKFHATVFPRHSKNK